MSRVFFQEIPPERNLLSRLSAGLHDASVAELCALPVRRIERTLRAGTHILCGGKIEQLGRVRSEWSLSE